MKKRLQAVISLITLVILATGMLSFVAVGRRHMDRRLTRQITEDNLAIAQTVASMVGRLAADTDEETVLAALRSVCMSVSLPNSGFICVVDDEGRLVAGPPDSANLPLDRLSIIPEGSESAHRPGELPRDRSTVGTGVYEGDSRTDVIAATPIPGTSYTVLIHQDHASVRSRSLDSAVSLAIPGAVIAVLLAAFAYFVVDSIVSGYNSRLEIANAGLIESNRKRSQLIHILCHDLKNPVGAIRTAAQMLRGDSRDTPFAVGLIDTSAKAALEVIENVRQSEALSSGKRTIRLESVDLAQCVRTSVDMLGRTFSEKGVNAQINVSDGSYALAEETSLCNSVLNNLLSNAVKFSERGSTVMIDGIRTGDWMTLSVRDNGIGMPPEILSRVFEPTAQTSRPGTEGESGTGFGMPLVKQFVESYGGRVRIASTVASNGDADHGTEVMLYLRQEEGAAKSEDGGVAREPL